MSIHILLFIFMASITPLGDRVVVQSPKAEETTTSGFIVAAPEKSERPQSGNVTSIGPDVKNVNVGDTVIFKEFIPATFTHEEEDFLILPEEDILAKIS